MITYIYIETQEHFEQGIPVGYRAYIVQCNMPFDCTFDSIDGIHFQYDLNESNT
jgi:hypothetical protein